MVGTLRHGMGEAWVKLVVASWLHINCLRH